MSALMVLLLAALLTASCGAADQSGNNDGQTQALALSGSLPGGAVQQSYNAVLTVSGGAPPYQFSIVSGTLPPGISLNPSTGSFTGQPTQAGSYTFTVRVTDSPGPGQGSQSYRVAISGGGGGGGSISVSVSPTSATLSSGATEQFTATVTGTSQTAVTWSASTGSVNVNGLYTAPTVQAETQATVTATSQADPAQSATAAVTINPDQSQKLQITTSGLEQGQLGEPYGVAFAASGGTQPYSWSISAGNLPPGITFNASGDLAGTPTSTGTYNMTVVVTDASNSTASSKFSVQVVAGNGYDGPAQLPIATVASSMADSPAPGSVINVNADGDLQDALNNAQCGDTIQLQAGATFTGLFTLPAKGCNDQNWIIIRTSSPDSSLPPEGQRLTPCYAGVGSLQGRPAYNCSNPTVVTAKVQLAQTGDGPFQLANGANFYRFLGLEITRQNGLAGSGALITLQGTADHIILDRSWLHGNAQDETSDGFAFSGGTNIAVIDSYFNDFHCISISGSCTDAHAVNGGLGNTQDGPYKIQDNFLEASGEAIMFGGGAATKTPTDITIVFNHFWKPWQWMPGNVPFVGGANGNAFIVKNHMELKNAVRVLAEDNLMENCWGGFSQTGYGIVLSPKNQYVQKDQGEVCPICEVTDVTIRFTHVAHAGGGIMMATSISGNGKDGGPAKAGTRWSIHDVVLDDISKKYVGEGNLFTVANAWPHNPLNTVTINHITGFPDPQGSLYFMGNLESNPSMYGFVFTNSIVTTGRYPIWNVGGGNSNCAYYDVPVTTITTCFTTYTFNYNALVASPQQFGPSKWPKGNFFASSPNDVGFTQYDNGNGGNYQLLPTSPYVNAGSDGQNLGADIVALNAALDGVE